MPPVKMPGRARWRGILCWAVGLALCLAGGSLVPAETSAAPAPSCTPTRPDALGPFYKPNAPIRSSVGTGYVLTGTVRSAVGCTPLPGVRIEFWQTAPNGQYDDDHRATVIADREGRYRFESNFPPGYAGRPPHIHIRVTADRHQTLVTQHYPSPGQTQGTFDLVLVQ